MSYKAMDWAFQQPILDTPAKFVLLTIAKHADENMQSWPSIARLCALTGLSRTTVKRCIKYLQGMGYLIIQNRFVGNKKTSNVYTLYGAGDDLRVGRETTIEYINNNISYLSCYLGSGDDLSKDDEKNIDEWDKIAREIDNG